MPKRKAKDDDDDGDDDFSPKKKGKGKAAKLVISARVKTHTGNAAMRGAMVSEHFYLWPRIRIVWTLLHATNTGCSLLLRGSKHSCVRGHSHVMQHKTQRGC